MTKSKPSSKHHESSSQVNMRQASKPSSSKQTEKYVKNQQQTQSKVRNAISSLNAKVDALKGSRADRMMM
jgi:hypothetical protein